MLTSLLGAYPLLGLIRRNRARTLSVASKVSLPILNGNTSAGGVASKTREHGQKEWRNQCGTGLLKDVRLSSENIRHSRESLEVVLLTVAAFGDFAIIVFGFVLAILLCHYNIIGGFMGTSPMQLFENSYKPVVFSSIIVFWGLTGKELYSFKSLLFPSTVWHKAVEAIGFGLIALIVFSMLQQTEHRDSWIFFVSAAIIICLNMFTWRVIVSWIIRRPALSSRMRRRLIVIGGGLQTARIKEALGGNSDAEFVGWVQAIKPNHVAELEKCRMGSLHELGTILKANAIDIAILTESESLQREGVLSVAKACENEHVQFKMVPHFFEILISGLHSDDIGGLQLLGVDCLPLSGYRNRAVKRMVDIVGASFGLVFSFPIILIFGALVYWEAPGPILYKQLRQGRNGRMFYIFKIRSMQVNAEANGKAQWAKQNDQRRLRIGTFMRKWNIDEVPQFWNVFVGEMSLVGPRPERPELIARFKSKFPHYQARHIYRPGITGWAQVNGWRGDTDLDERIRHDIWYLENWSLWLDCRIMIQTFIRRENAY